MRKKKKKKFKIDHTVFYSFGFYLFPTIIVEKISCIDANGIEFSFHWGNIGYDIILWKNK
jgi:hypothetical protein